MERRRITYLRCNLVAKSPCKLSSGQDDLTDSDVLVDSTGTPFIPGTALAGTMRHYLDQIHAAGDHAFTRRWFGFIEPYKDEGERSGVVVLDARQTVASETVVRDGVRLDERKSAVRGAKYDYQVVERGATFTLRMAVWHGAGEGTEVDGLLTDVLNGFDDGQIQIGGKTTRGFGRFETHHAKALTIDLGTAEGLDAYVSFNWDDETWGGFIRSGGKGGKSIEVLAKAELDICGALMIRNYATTTAMEGPDDKKRYVDAEFLSVGGKPIIPGTTWAGAFRHHMQKVLCRSKYDERIGCEGAGKQLLDRILGPIGGTGKEVPLKRSCLLFSESVVEHSDPLNETRTAIDRFTGGAADGLLYTNRVAHGGETELEIRWDAGLAKRRGLSEEEIVLAKNLVEICVDDLLAGSLAVGGMIAVGAGMFRQHEQD